MKCSRVRSMISTFKNFVLRNCAVINDINSGFKRFISQEIA